MKITMVGNVVVRAAVVVFSVHPRKYEKDRVRSLSGGVHEGWKKMRVEESWSGAAE
jgi:hypothetical protein